MISLDNLTQFLDSLSSSNFHCKLSLIKLYLQSTLPDHQQLWRFLKSKIREQHFRTLDKKLKVSYLALLISVLSLTNQSVIQSESVQKLVEEFFGKLSLEEWSYFRNEIIEKFCEVLENFAGSQTLKSIFHAALKQYQELSSSPNLTEKKTLSLLCFLDLQVFNSCHGSTAEWIEDASTALFVVILESLHSQNVQQISLNTLLPSLIQYVLSDPKRRVEVTSLGERLLKKLKELMLSGDEDVALAGLVQFMDCFQQTNTELSKDDELLKGLQNSLVSGNILAKKRAFFVLESIWSNQNIPWKKAFFSLYRSLDEFGLYLVQQDWDKVDLLQPVNQEELASQETRFWAPVIWSKGLSHKNHQVQRLVLRTFLERSWRKEYLTEIQFSFLFEIFIPCLSHPSIQQDPNNPQHQKNGEEFLSTYLSFLEDPEKLSFLMEFLKKVFPPDISRGGLKSGISCFTVLALSANFKTLTSEQANGLLVQIQVLLGLIVNVHGVNFKLGLYKDLLKSLKSLIPPALLIWSNLLSFLSSLPASLSYPSSPLHEDLNQWIWRDSSKEDNSMTSALVSLVDYLLGMSNLKDCRIVSNRFLIVFEQFPDKLEGAIFRIIEILQPALSRLYRQSYQEQEKETKILTITQALLEGSVTSCHLLPAEVNERLNLLICKTFEEIYSYSCMGLEDVTTAIESSTDITELALSCLSLSYQYLQKSNRKKEEVQDLLGEKCCLLLAKVVSYKADFFQTNEGEEKKVEVRNGLLKCFRALLPSLTPETKIEPALDLLIFFSDSQDLSKSHSTEDSQSLRWICIQSLISKSNFLNCNIQLKADLFTKVMKDWESIDDSLFLTMIQILQPLLQQLYQDAEFTSLVSNKLFKDEQAQSLTDQLSMILWEVVKSAWTSFFDSKKTVEICSGFIRLVYLPESFILDGISDKLHGVDGPLYWVTLELMEAGKRSARVLLLTTIHLLKGLQMNLSLVETYIPYFTFLVLHDVKERGQADFLNSQFLENEIGDVDEDLVLAFQTTVIASRVAFSCFIYSLADQSGILTSSSSSSTFLMELGTKLWDHFLQVSTTDELQAQTQYRVGSQTHRAKLRLWQTLALLSPFVLTQKQIKESLEVLMKILQQGNTSSVRMYVEMVVCCLLNRQPALLRVYIYPPLQNYEKRHEALPAYILIGYQVAMRCKENVLREKLLKELICFVFPWTMSHNHATRAFAQLTLDALIQNISELNSYLETQKSTPAGSDFNLWPTIGQYLMDNKDLTRLKRGLGSSLRQLQVPETDEKLISLKSVFQVPNEKDTESIGFEGAPESLLERIQIFLAEERVKVRDSNTEHLKAKESGSGPVYSIQRQDGVGDNLQRKITPSDQQALISGGDLQEPWNLSFEHLTELRAPVFDQEDLLKTSKQRLQSKQKIILVASLIDKIPNLAGLARSCEVFQAEQLILADHSITKTHQFSSISVTAEDWINIEEVKPVALQPWLSRKQSKGYSLLGLEQTSESKTLSEFQFPEKCVLLLGREKEGIPADLLQLMDFTIEIPQLGLIRSLNVHVSGAIALYEFVRQQSYK